MRAQSIPRLLLASLRPEQWTKNLLVLAGVVFGGRLLEPSAVAVALAAFVIFCALIAELIEPAGIAVAFALATAAAILAQLAAARLVSGASAAGARRPTR